MSRPRTHCYNCYKVEEALIDPYALSIFFPPDNDFFKHVKKGPLYCKDCATNLLVDSLYSSGITFYKGAQIYKALADNPLKTIIGSIFIVLCPDCNDSNLSVDFEVEKYTRLKKIQRNLLSGIGISPNFTDGIIFCEKCVEKREKDVMEKDPTSTWFHTDQNKSPIVWSLVEKT